MSRPKYYWHPIVKKMVMRYPGLKSEQSAQSHAYAAAIETTLAHIASLDNGPERLKAIRLVCFERKYTIEGAADEINYSPRTVQRWINSFVNQVGRNVGF